MRYEVLLDQFYDGVRIREKGEIIEFGGFLSPRVAKPLDAPAEPEQKRETLHAKRRGNQTH